MSNRTYVAGYCYGDSTSGQAGKRQLEGAAVGLQHNIGLGGAAVVGVYKKPS